MLNAVASAPILNIKPRKRIDIRSSNLSSNSVFYDHSNQLVGTVGNGIFSAMWRRLAGGQRTVRRMERLIPEWAQKKLLSWRVAYDQCWH
jgi:hypothetical protein